MEREYKILIVGSRNSGKTSFRRLWCNNYWQDDYEPSSGVSWSSCQQNSKLIHIYDCSDTNCLPGFPFDLVILMFDLSSKESFEECKSLYTSFKLNLCVLVGNKADKTREISRENINTLVHTEELPYYELSLLTGENLENFFQAITSKYSL
jgi:GTPase SAR1 family protein